jgi:hypothetical protein
VRKPLQLLAALGDFLFGERGLVEAELTHQRALFRARHLHAQRLRLRGLRFAFVGDFGFRLAFQVGFEIGEVLLFGLGLLHRLLVDLRLVTALALGVLHHGRLGAGPRDRLGGRGGSLLLVVELGLRAPRGCGLDSRLGGGLDGGALLRGHAIPRV